MSVTYKINFFLSPRWTRRNLTDDVVINYCASTVICSFVWSKL